MSIDNATPEEWYAANLAATNALSIATPRDIEGLNRALDRPFGELALATRAYVFLLHQMGKVAIEQFADNEWIRYSLVRPSWTAGVKYRVRAVEEPKTKPSIDWSQIKPEYKWLARDDGDTVFVYTEPPTLGDGYWTGTDYGRVDLLASYKPGTCNWKDSLVERPAGI